MKPDEFRKWRETQIARLPKTGFGRWWQSKIRALYRWALEEKSDENNT